MGSCTMATSTSTPLLRLLLLICFTLTFATTSTQDIEDFPPYTAYYTAHEASPGTEITIHKIPFLPLTLPFPLPTFLLDALKYLISLFKLESFLTVERTALRNGLFTVPTTFQEAKPLALLFILFTILSGPVAPFAALLWLAAGWTLSSTVGELLA